MTYYILTGVERKESKYGGHIVQVNLMDFDGVSYRTYLDPKYSIYSQWHGVLNGPGACIVSDLNIKNQNKNIINADSKPKIVWCGDPEDLGFAISDLMCEPTDDVWHDIFE